MFEALLGGVLIGLAVTLMLVLNGRVTGISGIVSAALAFPKRDNSWRYTFVAGLIAGGFVLHWAQPEVFLNTTNKSLGVVAVAGLLVGFGTVMGSGCTSGHGVCGMSRFSIRSLVATLAFMAAGAITVAVMKGFGI